MKMNRLLAVAGMAAILSLGTVSVLAQPNQQGQRGPGGGRGGNFDPAQFRERMMDRVKEQLEITDDAEWKAIQPLVQKVMDSRMSSFGGMGRSMFGGRRGGDNNNGNADRRPPMFGQANPDAEALQKAVDGKASNADLKTAIAKYQDSRKAKQAELEKAQADLRKVLSVRQEAIATLNGWL